LPGHRAQSVSRAIRRGRSASPGRYGSADVLALDDISMLVVGDDDVLIHVHAAGVGPDAWHLMTGLPYMVRLMGNGLRKPKSPVPGWDVAGSVEAVGIDPSRHRLRLPTKADAPDDAPAGDR
jgi:D-arabinose 1-dehydrogenase-like Zn-dependent alcohol dehydrogenase